MEVTPVTAARAETATIAILANILSGMIKNSQRGGSESIKKRSTEVMSVQVEAMNTDFCGVEDRDDIGRRRSAGTKVKKKNLSAHLD